MAGFHCAAGWAMQRIDFLIYATGGWAWNRRQGRGKLHSVRRCSRNLGDRTRDTLLVATIGGGLEYAFWDHMSLGVEARYTRYGSHTFNGGTLAVRALLPSSSRP